MDEKLNWLGAFSGRLWVLCALAFFMGLLPHLAKANPSPECVVIDSDVDLDDIRAIAVLAGSKHVVAIVTTEGISRPREGADAVEHFLGRIGADIPVIRGESPNPSRGYVAKPGLPTWRKAAEHLNGTFGPFPNPELPSAPAQSSITD
jgi:inosine-uridine nucleoside N-ribohydrolase